MSTKALLAIMLLCVAVSFVGCGSNEVSSSGATGSSIQFASSAIKALPQYSSSSYLRSRFGMLAAAPVANADLIGFFKQECQYESDNYCPSNVTASSSNKFTMQTLLGAIYHAQMYAGALNTSCGEGTAATINATSLTANTGAGTPGKFVSDYYSLLNCYKTNTDSNGGITHSAYSADSDGSFIANLTARYNYMSQTDIFQVYTSLDDNKAPQFLAFNFAAATPLSSRVVLLVNLVDHKFAVKMSTGTGYRNIVAIGVGGVNTTGVPNAGYYYVRTKNAAAEIGDAKLCVNNADNTYDNTGALTNCEIKDSTANWTSATAVANYLGMTDNDKTRAAAMLSYFADDSFLVAQDVPTANDADTNFPANIGGAQ